MQSLRIGWRNLWRNGRRTAITLSAIAFGTAVLIATDALMQGMVVGMVRNATDLSLGEAQLHADGYLKDRSMYAAIDEPEARLAAARAEGLSAAPRSYGYGLVAIGTKSAGAMLWGLDPVREAETTRLAEHVRDGAFLGPEPRGQVVLGRKLARSLQAEVGSELVVVVQAADGSLGNELLEVRGVLAPVGESIDRGAALLHAQDFDRLFVAGGRVHEIAVNSWGERPLPELRVGLEALAGGLEVRTWRQLIPLLSDLTDMMGGVLWIFGAIFFVAAGLGVLNTLLMATHERVPELGVLKAIGTSPLRLVVDLTAEAFVLGGLGTGLGAAVGVVGAALLEAHGIDTSALSGDITLGGVAFDPVWRASLQARSVVLPVLVMWGVCVVAALVPAVTAARLDPVAAIRRT